MSLAVDAGPSCYSCGLCKRSSLITIRKLSLNSPPHTPRLVWTAYICIGNDAFRNAAVISAHTALQTAKGMSCALASRWMLLQLWLRDESMIRLHSSPTYTPTPTHSHTHTQPKWTQTDRNVQHVCYSALTYTDPRQAVALSLSLSPSSALWHVQVLLPWQQSTRRRGCV